MPKNFKDLEQKMPPESLARAKSRAKEIMAEMLLAKIRKNVGPTQEDLTAQLIRVNCQSPTPKTPNPRINSRE